MTCVTAMIDDTTPKQFLSLQKPKLTLLRYPLGESLGGETLNTVLHCTVSPGGCTSLASRKCSSIKEVLLQNSLTNTQLGR